jgi:GNAT superfamily N-acetyltransferase
MWGDARALAIGFMCTIDDACAQHRIPCAGGHAILDSKHRLLWDANYIRVEHAEPPDARMLAAAADKHLGGERFRMIKLLHEEPAAQLRPELERLGYRSVDRVMMVLADTPPPDVLGIPVHAIERRSLIASREKTAAEHPRWSREEGLQMLSRDAVIATVVPERCYAVLQGDEIVSRCQVYGRGGIAQIAHIYTLEEHRRKGYARALVAHAARVARFGGAVNVFLFTDAVNWTRQFYGRMGFVEAGLMPRFLRLLD